MHQGSGTEWVIDASGCEAERLRDLDAVRALLDRAVRELDLHVVGAPLLHRFPGPGGVTALYLLSESHLACHTFPEVGLATFNLYCCRARPEWPWRARLEQALGASHVEVRRIARGASVPEPRA
jgi:S-adenosylmethionine decarboxylase